MTETSRRNFLKSTTALAVLGFPNILRAQDAAIVGQGEHRYQVIPNWGVLDEKTPVNNCHGIVRDREGHIILFTDHTNNNIIIYDKSGKLVHKWGTTYPGAHGLSIISEGDKEFLFLTDLQKNLVAKTSLDGKILQEWHWPETTGKYSKASEYKPSWTLHLQNGDFFVLDGYGKDYILSYNAAGQFQKIMGGSEGGIAHWGPHGGMIDGAKTPNPNILIAMSDQQYLLRLDLDGKKINQIDLPGGNPRQIRLHKDNYYVTHLADNWPKDRNSRGFVSVLDKDFKVIANIAGSAPIYDDAGKLQQMRSQEPIFLHPHDLILDDDDSIYVAQFSSENTYPVKLERL